MASLNNMSPSDDFLDGIPNTGAGGFEGLITRLCESATGQRFRLSSSGAQQGQDSASELGCGNRIKVETKNYRKSSLPARDLRGEVDQATAGGHELDLWILASSIGVPSQIEKELSASLSARGVELLILDVGIDSLPRITVLMAQYSEVVRQWAEQYIAGKGWDALKDALAEIRSKPAFLEAWQQLQQKFRSTLLGLEDARRRVNQHLLAALGNSGDCRALFGQQIDIQSGKAGLVRRTSIHDALDRWWAGATGTQRDCAVIGEEGKLFQ